jgi:CspA family cold shock protein
MKGKIKWYNFRKGYGFILADDGAEIFVHHSAIPAGIQLNEEDNVEFDIEDTDKGKQAKNLVKI